MTASIATGITATGITATGMPETTRITWTVVDRGFSVASRDGEYVGCVDQLAGAFVARDSRNTVLGRFDTADQARGAVLDSLEATTTPTAPSSMRWQRGAAVTVVLALGGLLAAGLIAPWL